MVIFLVFENKYPFNKKTNECLHEFEVLKFISQRKDNEGKQGYASVYLDMPKNKLLVNGK